MQEALLLAIDEMFRSSRTPELPGRLASKNYCRLARMIDEHVAAIYSADLAEHCAAFHQTASQTLGSRGRNRLILATMWRAYPRVRRRWPRAAAALRALAAWSLNFLINFRCVPSVTSPGQDHNASGNIVHFRGDSAAKMMTIDSPKSSQEFGRRISSVIASRASALVVAAIGGLVVLAPVRSDAQWWRSTPVDFESCADVAEKAATREEKTAKLAECNAKFAGRRKPGGGYTYYDFMQDRTFDIAGPNPTSEEQKKIDEQYTAYLERERRNSIAAALMAKQQQEQPQVPQAQRVQQVSLRSDQGSPPPETERVPVPVASPVKQAARIKAASCAKNSFSCEWPRLSEGINEIKKLFNPTQPNKQKKG